MTTVACQAKSTKNDKSCLRNLFCCCSCATLKKPGLETVEIYQGRKTPYESDLSLLTQSSCEEHALVKPQMLSVTSQTDATYPLILPPIGDQTEVEPPSRGVIINYCQTTVSADEESKPNIEVTGSLTDEMIKKDNQELVETILAKYLEYKHEESLIKQQIMAEQETTTAKFDYYPHKEDEPHSQNSSTMDSSHLFEGEFQEESDLASSSKHVELPEKSKSEPANSESCINSDALSLNEISKSDSYILLSAAESENKKLELVFLPSSSTDVSAGEGLNELGSAKSIQYKISCSDHEQSYTVGCMKENADIQNRDEREIERTTKSIDVGDFNQSGTPSVVKWKLIMTTHPDNHPPDS